MSEAPATNTAVTQTIVVDDRIQRLNQQTMIQSALLECQPGNRKGNISKCWDLDGYTRYACAFMHIVEFRSAQLIYDTLSDRMGDVNVRSLSGWLKTIRKSYTKIHNSQLEEMKHAEALMYQSGDMNAINTLTFAAIAPKFMAMAGVLDATSDPKILNVFLRLLEASTAAAKVQADSQLADARRDKIMTEVRRMLGAAKSGKKNQSETLSEVLEKIDEHLGIGGAP